MTKGKIKYPVARTSSLNRIYNYLRREVRDYKPLTTRFSELELALILDKRIGISGYEQGTAKPNEDSFVVGYFGIRDNAIETFSNQQVQNYNITKILQDRVSQSLESGIRYRKKGYEQISIEEVEADMQAVRDFFKFLLSVFKEKLK